MDGELAQAVATSHLRAVPADLLRRLFRGAHDELVAGGTAIHRQGEPARHCELVVRGVLRVYVSAPDGRTMTIRYCRPGGLLGAMSLYRPHFAMPATIEALLEVRLLRLSPAVLTDLVGRRPVAEALLRELSARANLFLDEIAGNAFATVRQRVARHLLDLAAGDAGATAGSPGTLVVRVSQQELADAAGTVREVVVRTLHDLREDELVETRRGTIVLLDPGRLADEEEWNLSS